MSITFDLDGKLVHRTVISPIIFRRFPHTHLARDRQYEVKFLVQGNSTLSQQCTVSSTYTRTTDPVIFDQTLPHHAQIKCRGNEPLFK